MPKKHIVKKHKCNKKKLVIYILIGIILPSVVNYLVYKKGYKDGQMSVNVERPEFLRSATERAREERADFQQFLELFNTTVKKAASEGKNSVTFNGHDVDDVAILICASDYLSSKDFNTLLTSDFVLKVWW